MQLTELIEESILVLKTNRLRTGLSALGIIIGIGSVIALMNLGASSQKSVTERIQSLGANLLTVSPGVQEQRGFFLRDSSNSSSDTLTYEDAQALGTSLRITTIDKVAAVYSSNAQLSYGSSNDSVTVTGVTENYFELRSIDLTYGSLISEQDNLMNRKVAVVSENVVEDLMEKVANPIGETIRLNGTSFTVVGVAETTSSFGPANYTVYIPLFTAQNALFGVDYVSTIYVSAKNSNVMDAAENQIGFLLLERHNLAIPEDADFSISSQEDILETVSEVTGTFTTMLTGIAAISLVVGGIGIMNIMLVTVTERTREIGIRKALGAKRKVIVMQFLIESILLTVVGGLIGVLFGLGISLILTKVLSMPAIVSAQAIFLSVVVSCAIGIIFGIYPAQKASKLQPIEALRYE